MLRKSVLSACMFAMVTWCSAGTASAQYDQNPTKDIYFTFSQPVTIPTMTLPAGKYLFRHIGANTGRQILQVFNGDGSKLQGTIMTVGTMRRDAPEKPEIRFIETVANTPPAVGTWWYPGMRQGWEFVYPRTQALRLAKTATEPILTTAQDVPANNMQSGDLVRLEPSGNQTAYSDSAAPAVSPLTGMTQRGEIVAEQNAAPAMSASPARQTASADTARTRLPQTASQTPLIALAGILAFALAAGLRLRRRDTV